MSRGTYSAHYFMQTLIEFEANATKLEFDKIFGVQNGIELWFEFTKKCGNNTTIFYRILDPKDQAKFDEYLESYFHQK